ncbi:hypothetical protein [Paenibacillus xylaniclasticus]|uniref:hypothetical protein n=1 Tax=Paenibacillus xylaniclasticus TaxID=588083 RepID=UPI000FD87987|nr:MULTISPECIES: hypothetical protein [Paenibacillus]GFN34075.1 hypothetical protein PCURB6_43350 [Paenibacillus curdlanolyticus]
MADKNRLSQELSMIPLPAQLGERSRLGIRQAVQERQEGLRSQRRRRFTRMSAATAVIALCVGGAALADEAKVWAAVQKVLQYVPGIGVMKEEEARADRYVLRKPIALTVRDGSVTILGMMSDERSTVIRMTGSNKNALHSYVKLVDGQGEAYDLDIRMSNSTDHEWTAQYEYQGKLDASGPLKLILFNSLGSSLPAMEVPVTLDKAERYDSYTALGATQTVNGVTITAITDRAGDKAKVSLISEHALDFEISDYGINGVDMHDESLKLFLTDTSGTKVDIEKLMTMAAPANEFVFKLPANGESDPLTLTIPEISVTYSDTASIELAIETNDHLNKTFELAGFPVTVTKTEKVSDRKFRAYFDFYYDENAPSSLYYFSLDRNNMVQLQEETGVFEFIEVAVAPDSKTIQLDFSRPGVVIRGPWTFELPVSAFEASSEGDA